MSLPPNPTIYEINTLVWLGELTEKLGRRITLANVPADEWDTLAARQYDAVWLMGVWQRSPWAIRLSQQKPEWQDEFRTILPDYQPEDVAGSPYAVRGYEVDAQLGGREGLAATRQKLADRGMMLLLDFVPNHTAPDHPWVMEHPEYYIQGEPGEAERHPGYFFSAGDRVIACGRDPNFPAWPDTAQVNAFSPAYRRAAIETLWDLAGQCDGVRCDMAMLMLNGIFQRTWGARAVRDSGLEFWQEVIHAVRSRRSDFLFLAEAYWDLEYELQLLGFNSCYDKRLYDRLLHENAASVRAHLSGDKQYLARLTRFIENHDEPRAAKAFGAERARAAAVAALTLPGGRLIHEGQDRGSRVRLSVHLGRRPAEPADETLVGFYDRFLETLHHAPFSRGEWNQCPTHGWPDNPSHQNLLCWTWALGEERFLIVVNWSEYGSQARIPLPWADLENQEWVFVDSTQGQEFTRWGTELVREGLYVELAPWQFHLLQIQPS